MSRSRAPASHVVIRLVKDSKGPSGWWSLMDRCPSSPTYSRADESARRDGFPLALRPGAPPSRSAREITLNELLDERGGRCRLVESRLEKLLMGRHVEVDPKTGRPSLRRSLPPSGHQHTPVAL